MMCSNKLYMYVIQIPKIAASVTEWSKVLRSGRSVFARVGSSPTACIFLSIILFGFIQENVRQSDYA